MKLLKQDPVTYRPYHCSLEAILQILCEQEQRQRGKESKKERNKEREKEGHAWRARQTKGPRLLETKSPRPLRGRPAPEWMGTEPPGPRQQPPPEKGEKSFHPVFLVLFETNMKPTGAVMQPQVPVNSSTARPALSFMASFASTPFFGAFEHL